MIDNTSKISLTYILRGECLVTAGRYNNKITIKKPVFKQATQTVTLNNSFVQSCLKRPDKPRRNSSKSLHEIYNNWYKLTEEAKLDLAVSLYVEDLGGTNPEWELL